MPTPLILDTDIGTDVDDALALAFALKHPEIDLLAITTVADDTHQRANIATKLLRVAGREDVEVAPGVGWSDPPAGRRSWFGHEGDGLIDKADRFPSYERDAVSLLLDETKRGDVEIATVGMQSNIARALDRDPDFAWRVPRLHVMGGVFAPIRVAGVERPPSADHNLMVDPEASVQALNAGMPTRYTPLNVTVRAPLLRSHLEVLRTGDELCRTLAGLVDIWADITKQPGDVVALLHDPLTVACVVDRRYVTIVDGLVSVVIHDGVVRTFIDNVDGRRAEVVTSVDGPGFADFWLETVMG